MLSFIREAYAGILDENSGSCSQIQVRADGGLFDLCDPAGMAIAGEGSFKPDANDLNGEGGKDGPLAD